MSSSISHLLTVRQAATAGRRASNLTGCVTLREVILRDVTANSNPDEEGYRMTSVAHVDERIRIRLMRCSRHSICLVTGALLLVAAGCAPTSVQTTSMASGQLPRPNQILVYDFAVTPDEVKLDEGISTQLMQEFQQYQGTPRTAQEIKIGHAVANVVAAELVSQIRAYGLPAERALGWPASRGNALTIKGQFTSIDEGNRTERVLIGFGTGRTSVQANVQVYELTREGTRKVESLQADSKSGAKPGMAMMMGVGALAGSVVTSTVVSGSLSAIGEATWETVDADGKRLAKNVAKSLGQFFVTQGWISPSALN